LPEQ
jgi:deoxyribodipyrimidine photolyase